MRMLDLCSGLGGASSAMDAAGWEVIRVELNPDFEPDICCDVREFSTSEYFDLVWASPPCTEFARESMPWCRTGKPPSMEILNACIRIIGDVNPRVWVIENVRGAIPYFAPYLGEPRYRNNPYFLWGNFPPLPRVRIRSKQKKEAYGSKDRAKRSLIPIEISRAVRDACYQLPLVL